VPIADLFDQQAQVKKNSRLSNQAKFNQVLRLPKSDSKQAMP